MRSHRGLTIGELASQAGVNAETIRFYERIGLMPEPDRTEGGHRLYAEPQLRRLAFIRRGRELGFGLEAIRALLELAEPDQRSCQEVQAIAEARLADVRAKIADLARLETILAATVSRCGSLDTGAACPVLEMLEAA
jgi:MerR family mercuric resistance operon transcriptional regulator